MANDQDNSKKGRQQWSSSITPSSAYKPDHEFGHEDRTGVGLNKTAVRHCEGRNEDDSMRLTAKNAYDLKSMVSSTEASRERACPGKNDQSGGVTREYIGEVKGQPAGAYANDRGSGPRINTTFTPNESKGFKEQ